MDFLFFISKREREVDRHIQVPAILLWRMDTLNESMTNGAQRNSRCGGKEKHQNTFRAILQLTNMLEICYSFSLLKEKFLVKNERQASRIAIKWTQLAHVCYANSGLSRWMESAADELKSGFKANNNRPHFSLFLYTYYFMAKFALGYWGRLCLSTVLVLRWHTLLCSDQ
jgi:hypothetical protein